LGLCVEDAGVVAGPDVSASCTSPSVTEGEERVWLGVSNTIAIWQPWLPEVHHHLAAMVAGPDWETSGGKGERERGGEKGLLQQPVRVAARRGRAVADLQQDTADTRSQFTTRTAVRRAPQTRGV